MKFMKLGSKPDAFQADGRCIRYVTSELATDVVVNVGEVKFYLHKQSLAETSAESREEISDEINMVDFPGGPKAFEICAKFCYGMTVTLNAYNVVAARCAAEYLEMTEDVDRGNLVFKIEDPSNITWSYTYNRKLSVTDKIIEDRLKFGERNDSVPKDWWVEDICELEIDLYKRLMITVKSKGRMDGSVIGEALRTYAVRWLPDSVDALISDAHSRRNKFLVETIVCLLPSDKGVGCSCSFLLKLLKVAILVGVDDSTREDLVNRISLKFHEASVKDLLIPARSPQTTFYDVELVYSIVNRFMMQEKSSQGLDVERNEKKGTDDFVLGHGSLLGVGKLVDGYLMEIAHDPNLSLSSFIDLSLSIPDAARPIHDGLYKAIDEYMKEHPGLTKAERKKICGLMDVRKLTIDASMHAAQNERLPLRVVVQVLFFEQVRAAAGVHAPNNNPRDASHSTTNTDEEWEKAAVEDDRRSLKKQMSRMKGMERTGALRHLGVHKALLHWLLGIPSHPVHLQDTGGTPYLR
ncbi:hypothetical protein Patl1_12589 [Pistacia atlantica]|uniref:Uncharacterized protein n=1 Tax=Pistacia atlantica TaxID=434234 RepID=A0ACC1ATB9_9ROSI|nr:hypothetical protein Patl1_12589 [Pistacia atlantica]